MRAEIQALVRELKRLRFEENVDSVFLADRRLEQLEKALAPMRMHASGGGMIDLSTAAEHAPGGRTPALGQTSVSGTRHEAPAPPVVVAEKKQVMESSDIIPHPEPFELPEGEKRERWEWLRDKVLGDPVCNAHVKPSKKVVYGVGNIDADIFFCGEAPGADEETQGEPFVGRAGQLLTRIINAMGLERKDVYIGNIMNWRPELEGPGNRPPTPAEIAYCLPYLKAQLAVVKPKVIVALGNTAVTGLLGKDSKRTMGKIRGTWLEFEGIPLLPTYHPAYILRNGTNRTKRVLWEDMLTVMEHVGMPISEKQRQYFT